MKKLLLVLIPAVLLSCEQYEKSQDSITTPVAFVDGMLRFESFETLHTTLESLEKAEEKVIDNGNTDSVLTIVNQSLPPGKLKDILLRAGVDPEIQDADDFFIPDFLRTFLNSALEIKVGNSIFKFADTNMIL